MQSTGTNSFLLLLVRPLFLEATHLFLIASYQWLTNNPHINTYNFKYGADHNNDYELNDNVCFGDNLANQCSDGHGFNRTNTVVSL